MTDTQKDIIAAVRRHAIANYDTGHGWDNVVEAYDDARIIELIGSAATSEEAIANMAEWLAIYTDIERDIQGA